MKGFTYILIVILFICFYFIGYFLGTKDSFAINCFSNGLIPIKIPNNSIVCWNQSLKYDDVRFNLDLTLGGLEIDK